MGSVCDPSLSGTFLGSYIWNRACIEMIGLGGRTCPIIQVPFKERYGNRGQKAASGNRTGHGGDAQSDFPGLGIAQRVNGFG